MSTQKTNNLKMHKWVPEDPVQREEFNDNFQKIDEGFGEVSSQLAQTEEQLLHEASSMVDKDIFPEVLDMHYESLKGVGWHSSETGGEITKNIAVTTSMGTFDLTLNNVASLYVNQLVTIYSDEEYYPNVIKSISGNIVTLKYPLQNNVSINDKLHNFYVNSTHPNLFGFNTIVDESLRNITKSRGEKLLFRILPSDFNFSGTGTNDDGGFKQDYTEPFAEFDTKVLTESRQGLKVITLNNDCFIKLVTYVKPTEGAVINYQISDVGNTVAYYNKGYTLAKDSSGKVEVSLFLRKGSYNLKIRNTVSGKSFALGKTEIFELSTRYSLKSFDRGVHLLLGDSWFEMAGMEARFKERLPNATFINFGVGGNKSDALVRRFNGTATNADIKNDPDNYGDRKDATSIPHIDYVWVMVGTNDYNQSVPTNTFKSNIDTLVKEVINRGAKPLIFNASVGQIGVGNNFTLSREFADLFFNQQYSINSIINDQLGVDEGTFTPTIAGSTTAGSHTYDIQEGLYRKIGKSVIFTVRVRMSVKDVNMAGRVKIKGLPFNPNRITALSLSRADHIAYGTTGRQIVAQVEVNGEISINKIVDNGTILATVADDTANNTMVYISGVYPIL